MVNPEDHGGWFSTFRRRCSNRIEKIVDLEEQMGKMMRWIDNLYPD